MSMKFVDKIPTNNEKLVKLHLRLLNTATSSPAYDLLAEDNDGNIACVLSVHSDGTIVRYTDQVKKLHAIGFQTDASGAVKIN